MSEDPVTALSTRLTSRSKSVDVVSDRLVRQFRALFEPFLFAGSTGEAPLGIHWCLAPPAVYQDQLAADGHPAHCDLTFGKASSRRMWAGGELDHRSPVRIGATVTRVSELERVRTAMGRSGPLTFVHMIHGYSTEGVVNLRERQDLVYRMPADATASVRQEPAVVPYHPDVQWTVDSSTVRLFRYSALTYNAHRVHYDLRYAVEQEGYQGLLVHGPLQATLILNLVARCLGQIPGRFEYRAVSPLIAGAPFTVCARAVADSIECWTGDAEGRICMRAVGRA